MSTLKISEAGTVQFPMVKHAVEIQIQDGALDLLVQACHAENRRVALISTCPPR